MTWASWKRFIGEDRFEIDGADAASEFLSRQGCSDKKVAVIWDAIALHTTPGIPQRKQPEVALLQPGAGIDVGAIPRSLVTPETVEIIPAEYPRLGFKKAVLEALGAVVRRKPMTGVVNLVGDVEREQEHLPVPGFCDVIRHSAPTSSAAVQATPASPPAPVPAALNSPLKGQP